MLQHSRAQAAAGGASFAGERLAFASVAEELAGLKCRRGDAAGGEELLWEALEARREVLGDGHESVAATEARLREALAAQCCGGGGRGGGSP